LVEVARRRAKHAGIDGRVRFEVAPAKSDPGTSYDLVTCFDRLHDMGDPEGHKCLREELQSGGRRKIRRAAETPFNLVIEARR